MDKITVPKGDYGFDIAFTIRDANGDAYDLTDYTITLKLWRKGHPATLILEDECDIAVAEDGTCTYTVTDTSFTSVGKFIAELELTKENVVESTKSFELEVTESG